MDRNGQSISPSKKRARHQYNADITSDDERLAQILLNFDPIPDRTLAEEPVDFESNVYDSSYQESSARVLPYYRPIQGHTSGEEPANLATDYPHGNHRMGIDPASFERYPAQSEINSTLLEKYPTLEETYPAPPETFPTVPEVNRDSMTLHSTASPKELQQLKRKLARYRRYDRPSRLKLSEIARAQRFVVNDELKWNNKDFKCKIIIQSFDGARSWNLAITYESSYSTLPDTRCYLGVQGPTKLEELLLAYHGLRKPKRARNVWKDFSVVRNGKDMGNLEEIRLQVYNECKLEQKVLEDVLEPNKDTRGPMPLEFQSSEVSPVTHNGWTPLNSREIRNVVDPQLWNKKQQEEEVSGGDSTGVEGSSSDLF